MALHCSFYEEFIDVGQYTCPIDNYDSQFLSLDMHLCPLSLNHNGQGCLTQSKTICRPSRYQDKSDTPQFRGGGSVFFL